MVLVAAWAPVAARAADDAAPEPAAATCPDVVTDAAVEAALAQAGDNRAELEQALAAAAAHRDPRRAPALRFLVANMPHHGYVTTALRDAQGRDVPYDPLAYDTFAAAREALEALEKEHGTLDFARDGFASDLEHVTASFLAHHLDAAFEAWDRTPAARRVTWPTFLEHVLPYRGSEEPLDLWMPDLVRRYAPNVHGKRGDMPADELWAWLAREVSSRVRFDERYYLHPTDQGFGEMGRSGLGRCEDITNMQTFAARSLGLAVAADYTPWWAHRDNNHAWAVLLDADGQGHTPAYAHAAKVYRKTWSLQPGALADRLPEGREAPNRFLSSRTYRDVTDQYRTVYEVPVSMEGDVARAEPFAYVAVFNGGVWRAIDHTDVVDGLATFHRLGGDVIYLPAVFPKDTLEGAAPPFLLDAEGNATVLPGTGEPVEVLLAATRPTQRSVDTGDVTPTSSLTAGASYRLQLWRDGAWTDLRSVVGSEEPVAAAGVPADGLYRLLEPESDDLERIFTIEAGRQRFR